MNTFIEAAALFGRPYYDEKTAEDSIWGTIFWALGTLDNE